MQEWCAVSWDSTDQVMWLDVLCIIIYHYFLHTTTYFHMMVWLTFNLITFTSKQIDFLQALWLSLEHTLEVEVVISS